MRTVDRAAGAALALLALGVLIESRKLPFGTLGNPGPAWMPVVLALTLLGFGLVLLVTGGASPGLAEVGWAEWKHAVAILGTCAFAALFLERLGYRLTIMAVLLFLVGVVERRGLVLTLTLSLALALGSFLVFDTLLRVPLPRGPLGI